MEAFVNVNVDKNNSIANIEFFHPKGNSLDSYMLNKLVAEINNLDQNDEVKSIVIKSSGSKVFCSGASFDELLEVNDQESADKFFSGFANLILAIKNSSKIVIGSIEGKSVGGGVGFISAMDFVIASKNASVKLSELSIGIGPYVIAPAVERKIGKSALQELSFDAQSWRDSKWALQKGLFNKLVEENSDIDNEVDSFAKEFKDYSLDAIRELKRFYWKGSENWDTELFENAKITARLALSDFTKDILGRFKNKK